MDPYNSQEITLKCVRESEQLAAEVMTSNQTSEPAMQSTSEAPTPIRRKGKGEEYSSNPHTVRNRKARSELQGFAKRLSDAASADRKAKSKARKRFQSEDVTYWQSVQEGGTFVEMPLRIRRLEQHVRQQEAALANRWLAATTDAEKEQILKEVGDLEMARRDELGISHFAVEESIQQAIHQNDRQQLKEDTDLQARWLSSRQSGRAAEEAARRTLPSLEDFLEDITDETERTENTELHTLVMRVADRGIRRLGRTIRAGERDVHIQGIAALREAGSQNPEEEMRVFYEGGNNAPLPERYQYAHREGTTLEFPGVFYKDEIEDLTMLTDTDVASSAMDNEELIIEPYVPSEDEDEEGEGMDFGSDGDDDHDQPPESGIALLPAIPEEPCNSDDKTFGSDGDVSANGDSSDDEDDAGESGEAGPVDMFSITHVSPDY